MIVLATESARVRLFAVSKSPITAFEMFCRWVKQTKILSLLRSLRFRGKKKVRNPKNKNKKIKIKIKKKIK